jgi:hypothetical protein
MRTTSTAHASAFPQPSRTIFAVVVQACFPSPCPRTRSTCRPPGARALMRDPPLTACRYPRCCNRSISLLSRSVCDPHCMAPLSPAVSMRIPSASVPPRAPPDPLCRSYLRLAEPACIPSHLYPNRASSLLSAQSCCSPCSVLCAAFSLARLRFLKPGLYRHSPRTLLFLNPHLLLNRPSARIMNSTRAPPIEPVLSEPASK